jgi:hypothetical protein
MGDVVVDRDEGDEVPSRPGVFILSLDLELAWGSWRRAAFPVDAFAGGSAIARRIDALCRELRLPATWAVVGALHDLSIEELGDLPPEASVSELRPHLGPYREPLPTVGRVTSAPHAFLDPQLVRELAASPAHHEIATHTYFHAIPTTAHGMRTDVEACRSALPSGTPVRTVVYPRDAVCHVDALAAAGIDQYRAPGVAAYFRQTGRPRGWGRIAHTLDQALGRRAPLADVATGPVTAVASSGILTLRHGVRRHIPARALRRRYLCPLDDAVRTRRIYHLWTHPWNLALPGSDTFELLGDILVRAAELRERGDIDVLTIAQLADRYRQAESA